MIVVHHLNNSRSQRILWLLEELGVPYEIKFYQRDATTNLAPPELKAVHPLGKSPVLTDGARTIAESGAIVDYLIRTYGNGRLAPAADSPDHETYLEWLHYAEGSAMLPLMLLLYTMRLGDAAAPLKGRIDDEIANHLGYVNQALEGREYLVGGAFSGADRDKPGLIKLADGGTLFLDEIGDMPLEAQAKLLRVLQSREVFPLGATAPEQVDVRIVCATHRDLHQFVKDGKFRGDLFARVSEHLVKLPPLRERKEDVYQLAKLFCRRYGTLNLTFSFSFVVALLHHDWPFNVRELESCIKRATALAEGDAIDVGQLPDAIASLMRDYGARAAPGSVSERERESRMPPSLSVTPSPAAVSSRRPPPTEAGLRELLMRHRGNIAAVGRELGKERMQVHRWMKRYNISVEEYRD